VEGGRQQHQRERRPQDQREQAPLQEEQVSSPLRPQPPFSSRCRLPSLLPCVTSRGRRRRETGRETPTNSPCRFFTRKMTGVLNILFSHVPCPDLTAPFVHLDLGRVVGCNGTTSDKWVGCYTLLLVLCCQGWADITRE
jgi:hypothetical protein